MAAGVAWLPLALLSTWYAVSHDIQAWSSPWFGLGDAARYLVALPLLVVGHDVLTRRLDAVLRALGDGTYIDAHDHLRFDDILASTRRVIVHRVTGVGVVLLSYTVSLAVRLAPMPGRMSVWTIAGSGGVSNVTLADWWRTLVSEPLLLATVLVWLLSTALWVRVVWRLSTLDLTLLVSHPDLAAGLLFVSRSVTAFAPFGLALGTLAAARVAHTLAITQQLDSVHIGMLALVVAGVLVIAVGPLLPLARPIRRAQLVGLVQYGALANELGRQFEDRWIGRKPVNAAALAAPDFSATTDLYSIVANVTHIRLIPVDARAVVALLAATLIPFLPVACYTMPAAKILHAAKSLLL